MPNLLKSAALAATLAMAHPAVVQAQNVQQLLQGLTTGNQNQDQALRDAFERGYQKGRQDEAQLARRSGRSEGDRNSDDRGGSYRGQAPQDPRDNTYRR